MSRRDVPGDALVEPRCRGRAATWGKKEVERAAPRSLSRAGAPVDHADLITKIVLPSCSVVTNVTALRSVTSAGSPVTPNFVLAGQRGDTLTSLDSQLQPLVLPQLSHT